MHRFQKRWQSSKKRNQTVQDKFRRSPSFWQITIWEPTVEWKAELWFASQPAERYTHQTTLFPIIYKDHHQQTATRMGLALINQKSFNLAEKPRPWINEFVYFNKEMKLGFLGLTSILRIMLCSICFGEKCVLHFLVFGRIKNVVCD